MTDSKVAQGYRDGYKARFGVDIGEGVAEHVSYLKRGITTLRAALDTMMRAHRATHGLDGAYDDCIVNARKVMFDTEGL